MTIVKVGDIRKGEMGVYVVSFIEMLEDIWCTVIYQNGQTNDAFKFCVAIRDELIAHYDTWQEAVNSKEFKSE